LGARIVYHPEAEIELRQAVSFYGSRDESLPPLFLAAIDERIREISESPRRFPEIGHAIRRCLLRKFPFAIFYRDYSDRPNPSLCAQQSTSRLLATTKRQLIRRFKSSV
jgi:hypothetical protein